MIQPEANGPTVSVDEAIDRAAQVLERADQVALACHLNPDPDAAGSMLGLAGYLASRGKSVVCSWGNHPFELPRWLSLMTHDGFLVAPEAFPDAPQVMVALDTASPDRLGMLGANAARANQVIVLDHHRTNPGFGSIVVLDPDASSTCELAFRLIERMGGALPDEAAAALYAGLLTDTGRFQYEATTPETLRVAAALRTHGFDHSRMGQVLFEENSLGYLKVLSLALERVTFVPAADLVWTYVTQADLAAAGTRPGDTDDLIDVVRTAREADVACLIRQQRDGRFKVSLRSKGRTDVGSIAASLGGGGHRLAAGYTSNTGVEGTVAEIVKLLYHQKNAAADA
jgi:bifunctional oligoribonuclease and PAP phosphatase NrnA